MSVRGPSLRDSRDNKMGVHTYVHSVCGWSCCTVVSSLQTESGSCFMHHAESLLFRPTHKKIQSVTFPPSHMSHSVANPALRSVWPRLTWRVFIYGCVIVFKFVLSHRVGFNEALLWGTDFIDIWRAQSRGWLAHWRRAVRWLDQTDDNRNEF